MAATAETLQNGVIPPQPPNSDTTHSLALHHSTLLVGGHVILSDVPSNVTDASAAPSSDSGCFLGFISNESKSRHVTSLGKLRNIRFMSIFRFKVWWTTHWTGKNGRDLECETQILLLENSADGRPYVVIIPIIDGSFRGSLQPGLDDNVDICVESGSTKVTGQSFTHAVYVESGSDPFTLVRDSIRVVRMRLGTFKLLEEKDPPGIVDMFGWCTWDAFYLKVHPEGVWEGVNELVNGGCPPGFVLIDDGWQSIAADDDDPNVEAMNYTSAGEQMPCRLVKFEENYKFRNYQSRRIGEDRGMGAFVKDMKEEFKALKYVYVWHALCGYWGGLRPGMPGLPESEVITPVLSPGLRTTMEDLAVDKIVKYGVGLPRPEHAGQMYEALHSHLESVRIDGVKVDVIHLLEMLAEDYGGRVELAKAYYKALTSSVKKHFNGNGVIASMEHCNDFMLLGTEAVCLGRVGDDFWCTDPSGDPTGTFWLQGCHMVHCAFNSLWMGNFIHPDWDMFQSTHPCADLHAASRAISGGPVYVSDAVGKHDFSLLKRLVLPDGSILRCLDYALPTKDCLFEDPLHDGNTLLKIWNLNTFAGVVGGFNCQGGGWCRETRRNQASSDISRAVTARVSPSDIQWKSPCLDPAAEFVVYFFRAKKLVVLTFSEGFDLSLEPFEFELLTVSPVTDVGDLRFAPVGLVNMLNSGGAVRSCLFDGEEKRLEVAVRGTGEMRVFATRKPRACRVSGKDAAYAYEHDMVAVPVPWDHAAHTSIVEFFF